MPGLEVRMNRSITHLSEETQRLLACPACRTAVSLADDRLVCANPDCRRVFPVVDGVPVLINDDNSLFRVEDFTTHRDTFFETKPKSLPEKIILALTPGISANIKGKANYARFVELLLKQSKAPRVLVLGGSIQGQGMEPLLSCPEIEIVDTDVAFGPRTGIVCDAHDIPFADGSFDGVVAQAVLEHVADPFRCVDEIHRVLKDDALVYAETPFMQQMHGAPYDFTRFTIQGYRRLFRRFAEIDCGTCTGPGMALAWAYRHFMFTLAVGRVGRGLAELFVGWTAWHLKYLDRILVDRPYAVYSASGYHFLGTKSTHVATDSELIERFAQTTKRR